MNPAPIRLAFERMTWLRDHGVFSKQFDLGYWGTTIDTHPLDQPEDPACGFGGCFMGWAIHQRWFERWGLDLGLTAQPPVSGSANIYPMVLASSAVPFNAYANKPVGRQTEAAIDAVAQLFGIHRETLALIIYEESYRKTVTPEMVRDRLGELLEHGEDRFTELVVEANDAYDAEHADGG